ncbi:MAG TPA: aminotransferase class V-fold PLP-dependent enzyme [Candidatus Polarisedimenticolaceae bacterium]|nr:aminotransferase class V-fold PLP-dependent enzyme [Candidatus Polarisedimenticolaceae bacterium]
MSFEPIASLARARHEFGEHGGVNMSIEASTTFTVMHAQVMPEIFQGRLGPREQRASSAGCYLYGRHFNPTVYVLGRYLAAMEGTEAGYCTSSGMSAIASSVLQACDPGHEIVAGNTLYGGTFALLKEFLPAKAGIRTTFVDLTDLRAVEEAMTVRTRVLYCETLSNPTLQVADIPRLAEIAHRRGAILVVDNTFSPLIVSPAQQGADVVVHSMTKFISGASDIIAGCVCGSKAFIGSMMNLHTGSLMLLGPTMDPRVAFELSLRLPHLGLRMGEHSRRAQLFAERLQAMGLPVAYPGLPSHSQHALLRSMANDGFGLGGILAVDLGSRDRAFALMEALQNEQKFGFLAVSLGYFDTLMSCSASSTSSELSDEDLRRAGISPGLVRISIGYTGTLEQRWEQFEAGLRKVGITRPAPVPA